tara:strand:- start:3268 stop:5118 length:1851 start_codon:yes stop_codon:yes gene_type:complete
MFSVEDNTVTYITESGNVISGQFDKTALKLTNIKIADVSLFENKELYSKLVDKRVSTFLADILENDLDKVQESFDSILGIWETRLKFDRVKEKLTEKVEKFNPTLRIITSPEFTRLVEVKNDLVKFLKESKTLVSIPEIRNTIKLSSIISSSFNIPKLSIENLKESQRYQIPVVVNHTLYDHLCKQELVAKELVEAKSNLDLIWLHNEKVQKLPSFIYESDDNISELVAQIITELPYFAMATKKQLTSLVENNLDLLADKDVVPAKDIRDFVAKIFEFKKPVKSYLLNVLNEKYGINVQNLTEQPTFNSLVKTQILIFESLAKLSPKNSVLKKVLYEFSESLKTKSGIESIDVSDFLNLVFKEADYTKSINETSLMNYLNFDQVADDLGKIGAVLKMIKANMGGGAQPMGGMGAPAMGGQVPPQTGMPGSQPGLGDMEGQFEPDGGELAGMGGDDMGIGQNGDPQMAAQDAEMEAGMEGDPTGGGMGDEMGGEEVDPLAADVPEGEDIGDQPDMMPQDQLVDSLAELESLIATLKDEIGIGGEEGGMEGEEDIPMEGEPEGDEMPPMEGEPEGDEGGEDGDDTHIDVNIDADGEGEDTDIDKGDNDKKFEKKFKKK